MFEAAELNNHVDPGHYKAQLPGLREQLISAQLELKKSRTPVLIVISGADGAGKGQLVNVLNEWLDPRGVDTHAFWDLGSEEWERPAFWRFWQALPARGRIGILFGSWYTDPVVRRIHGQSKQADFDAALDRIAFFERMLVEDGALILKFWLHLPAKIHRQRLRDLERDPKTHWRMLPEDRLDRKLYEKFCRVAERAIRHTDIPGAQWHLVEATDPCYRNLTVGRVIAEGLEQRLSESRRAAPSMAPTTPPNRSGPPGEAPTNILRHVDLSQKLGAEEYENLREELQERLTTLAWKAHKKNRASVLVFEGWDAAGKGSGIRRVTNALDARLYRVIPIGIPTDEEHAHHYLWRFWRHVPNTGRVTIFDRSWYGRVLVERVEGFARPCEWMRAYQEINDFEEQLVEHGIVLLKFWIHISRDEQLRRFKKREAIAYKRYKITPEDWRNRRKWNAYEAAVNEMVARTSTEYAPWSLIAGNDKRFARIQILKSFCSALETAL